jgi:hypothetical protein
LLLPVFSLFWILQSSGWLLYAWIEVATEICQKPLGQCKNFIRTVLLGLLALIFVYDLVAIGLPSHHVTYYALITWLILLPFLRGWWAACLYSSIGLLLLGVSVFMHVDRVSSWLSVHAISAAISISWMFVWLGVVLLQRKQHYSMKSKQLDLLKYDYPSIQFLNQMMMVLLFANAVALTVVIVSGFLLSQWSWGSATMISVLLWALVLTGVFDYSKHCRGDRVSWQGLIYMSVMWFYLLSF